MSGVATAIVGSAVVGAYASDQAADAQADAARRGGDAQLQASRENIEFQREALDKQLELNEPWQREGLTSIKNIRAMLSGDRFDFEADPGYRFRVSEMEKAVGRRASARGRLASPATDKAIARYTGGLASQEYQNAFNRYTSDFNRRVNTEMGMANLGRGAAASSVGAVGAGTSNVMAQNTAGANALANAYANTGAAQASGYQGMATAANHGIQNYLLYDYIR